MLKEGDVISIKSGHKVSAYVPEHFVYSNKRGCFDMTNHTVTVGGDFDYLEGDYIVTKTASDGGGSGHGRHDTYPNGHHVFCKKIPTGESYEHNLRLEHEIDFYQSGCFTAMITDIKPIGEATQKWVINS